MWSKHITSFIFHAQKTPKISRTQGTQNTNFLGLSTALYLGRTSLNIILTTGYPKCNFWICKVTVCADCTN